MTMKDCQYQKAIIRWVDYVVIIPIKSKDISGGIHSLRIGSQDGFEILDKKLMEGEALILNDSRLYHYASQYMQIVILKVHVIV